MSEPTPKERAAAIFRRLGISGHSQEWLTLTEGAIANAEARGAARALEICREMLVEQERFASKNGAMGLHDYAACILKLAIRAIAAEPSAALDDTADPADEAYAAGHRAFRSGTGPNGVPKAYRAEKALLEAWKAGWCKARDESKTEAGA